jgi:uncharacterized protein YukE
VNTTPGNPLVATADTGVDPWAGVWIAEDIELIASGVKNGSWIDGTLGVIGAGLDALAVVSDPLGTLLQYGVAWIIEHVKPLRKVLDWLAGNPGQITAHAQTWRNVAATLTNSATDLADAVRRDVASWGGSAGPAYRDWAKQQQAAITALGTACDTMAVITEAAGALIAAVRVMVRDAIATLVSRLISYAIEEAASLGAATPWVVEQVTTLCASWGAKIARWVKALLNSLRKLVPIVRRLGTLIEDLKKVLGRLGGKGAGKAPGDPGPVRRFTEEAGGKPPWPVADGTPGSAHGKSLNPPNARHTVAGAKHGQIKGENSVILKGEESAVQGDVRQIASGKAEWNPQSQRYEINGRSYGVEPSGTVFPDSGPGIVKLDRNEYAALKEIARADGDVSKVPAFSRNPRFTENPEVIAKAKAIYDGTYKP